MSEKYDICIVGSGIIGISTAYFLSKSALKICVIDQCEDVALVSSEVNGGQLNPHRVDHLNAYTGKTIHRYGIL
jgi:glycine/D-amino acid oxidase-like deaminating enzyme